MERKVEKYFKKWQTDIIRKPLILYGPKQVGKTFTVLKYGQKEYKNTVYFNTDNNLELIELFKKEKATEKIILKLSLLSGETILQNDTLLVFDNVNEVEIVKGLKLFGSEHSKYHIMAITSRRENLTVFKGEELQFKGMYGMDFEEYLWARDEKKLSELIKELDIVKIIGNKEVEINEIKTSSSEIAENGLFIALKGTSFDGHNYYKDAIKNGAKAIICEKALDTDITQIIVM